MGAEAGRAGEIAPIVRTTASVSAKAELYRYIQGLSAESDTKLPAETELAARLGISRVTLRRVLAELEQEGLILRMHGRGTFINPEALEIKANLMLGLEFLALLRSNGYEASSRVVRLERVKATDELAQILHVEVGCDLYEVEKAYYADDKLAIVSIDVFPCELVGDDLVPADLDDPSVFDLLATRAGRVVERDRINIQSVSRKSVKRSETCRKQMSCDSVLVFTATNYDQLNRPVFVDVEYYDTSIVKFGCMRVKSPYVP